MSASRIAIWKKTATGLGLVLAIFAAAALSPARAVPDNDAEAKMAAEGTTPADLEKLFQDGRYQAAAELAASLRTAAAARGDEAGATLALIREVQARIGLGAAETALRLLLDQPEPAARRERLIYRLFRGESLSRYFDAYGWEIRQREQTGAIDQVAVDKWTADQLNGELLRAFGGAWEERAAWGAESVAPLSGLLEQNDYPPRIRGTLRDTLSYLFAEALANSSRFTPQQGNEIYRLDLGALLAPAAPAAPGAALDETLHPLERMARVLADLEAWHRANGRPEAALEAYLARLDGLRVHFSAEEDRERFDRELAAALAAFPPGLEWRAMGLVKLGEWRRESDRPDALKRAHATFREAAAAFPKSIGGRRARALLDQLEMPQLSFEAVQIDGPGRPSLTVNHANLKRIHLRAYRLPAEAERSFATMFRSEARALAELVRSGQPVAEWQAELRDPGDFRSHRTYLAPPLEKLGHYVIFASQRPDFALENNLAMALRLTLSELVVLGRPLQQALEAEVEVRAGRDGRALPATSLELLASAGRNPYRSVARQETDGEGKAGFDLTPVDPGSQLFLAASRGADHIFTGSWLQRPYVAPQEAATETSQLIFTDRGVYRPGQQILFKAIAFELDQRTRTRRTLAGQPLTVELFDANGQQVASLPLVTNRHGSVSGAIPIPPGRMLGDWSLRSGGAWRSLKVEEYKRPTFELAILDPAAPLRLNQEARLAGSARYYFGMPLRAGKVAWRVTRTPNYPRWWYFFPPVRETQNVASGEGTLDAEGRFEISFLPRADERLAASAEGREISYSYRVSAELTDEGGETRSAERSFRAGFVMVDASLEPARPFFAERQKIEVALRRVDLDGQGRAGRGSWRLLRLGAEKPLLPAEMPVLLPPGGETFALPGDRTPPRHRATYDEAAARRLLKDGPEVARGELTADQGGNATLELPAGLPAGLYRVRYETADEAGARIERSAEILVARERMPGVGLAVVLEADRATAEPGEELHLAAGSGLPQVPAVVEIFRGERRIFRQELPPGEMGLLRYRVAPEDRGGLVVEIKAVADYQLLNLRRTVAVPVDRERLKVSFASFRDRLRPGQREKFTIAVESLDGASLDPQLIEILSSMYDRSLDLFAPPPAGSPFASYQSNGEVMRLWSSTQHSYPFFRADSPGPASEYPQLRGDRLTLYDRVDIGGMRGGFAGGVKTMAMSAPMPESMPMARAALDGASPGAPPPPPPAPPGQDLALASGAGAAPAPAVRANFAETAFFEPHLEPGNDGRVSFEFEVPDSVTEWNVFTHALSDDFRFGSDRRTTRTVKELLVRPYLPRFLREGDRAELRVAVDHTGEQGVLAGAVDLELLDEATGESLLTRFGLDPATAAGRAFEVEPGKSAILTFPLKVPAGIGPVVLKVVGATRDRREGELSDGERRLLPILPSRLHLVQSRFAALDGRAQRTLSFEELRQGGDPSRIDEKLVLTLDGQLFTSVLRALPYLVDYPYRCTEQNLNRFAATGIMTALFDRHPAIARLAEQLAKRDTPRGPLPAQDANRGILLEESPWLAGASRGGEPAAGAELERILDPKIARAVRDGALEELRQAQDPSGGFPWWPGGQPSVFFTVYLLQGFARAAEAGVEVPREMIEGAWGFVYRELAPEIEKLKDPGQMRESWYTVTWLNYVLSTYPDPSWTGGVFSEEDRERMLEASLQHWRELPRRVRLYLALTALRLGRAEEAKQVLESVMDGARTTPDQGTFWQPEDRAWLFWWDRIETHAVALRALMEIAPQDERRHGLVLWLMLNKKLNQWDSTRSTAEVIYSLAAYLEKEGKLGVREEVTVDFAGRRQRIVFAPDSTETRRQLVQEGKEIEPARDAAIEIGKETPGLLFASATWHFSTEKLPAAASSDFFAAHRRYFRRVFEGGQYRLEPLSAGAPIAVGDEVEVELEIEAKHAAEFVHLRDPRAAGFEPVDLVSGWRWDLGIGHYREIRDSATNFFFETLPPGKMTLKYRLRAATAGTFRVGPATLQSMYAPEFAAYSAGAGIVISP